MKCPVFAGLAFAGSVAVLLFSLRLEADEGLKNGDFSEGINHWSGDGKDVAQIAPDLGSKGMIVKLDPDQWTSAGQQFTPTGTDFDCSITYKLAPGTEFSDKEGDYRNVPAHLGYANMQRFRIPKGTWMMMMTDFGDTTAGTYSSIKPKMDGTDEETFQTKLTGLTTRQVKTITLAFPPGHGAVIILNVSVANGAPPVLADTTDFTLTGEGITIQKLANGEPAFSNRDGLLWQDLPADLVGLSYTQTALTTPPHLTVHAKNDCTVQVIADENFLGWNRVDTGFSFANAKKSTAMRLYQKKISAGQDLVIPENDVGTVLVVLPN